MNQFNQLLEQDEAITNQIASAKKLYYNEINNNLNCSLDLLQTIASNYNIVKTIFSTFKSEENLYEYIEYLENQNTELQTNKYIKCLQEIIDSSKDYSFAQSFVDSLLDLNVDTWVNEEKYIRLFSVSISIKCDLFDFSLYCELFDYDDYCELKSYTLSLKNYVLEKKMVEYQIKILKIINKI